MSEQIILKPLQEKMVDELRQAMRKSKKVILQASTGVGKTVIAASITKSALDKGKTVLFIVHRIILANQTSEMFARYGIPHGVIRSKDERFDISQPCQVASIQTLKLRGCNPADLIIIDECVSPDTEILTETGWRMIDGLDRSLRVAQYSQDTGLVSFVIPEAHIRKEFSGEMVRIYGKQTDMVCTPSHEQPIMVNFGISKKRVTVKDWKVSGSHFIPVAGRAVGGKKITQTERFLIMAAADGCWVGHGKQQIVQFQFSKQRKIDRFLQIVQDANLRFSETKARPKSGNTCSKRRFSVWMDRGVRKGLSFIKPLSEIGGEWAEEFIQELLQWDGSTKKGVLYWSGTNVSDVNYIQAVCSLGGITCNRNVQTDERKTSYRDVYRLVFVLSSKRGCQKMTKVVCENTWGYVVCVRVPYGNIIIRRNNKVNITGNCHILHKAHKDILANNVNSYIVGLTATPYAKELGKYFDFHIRPFSPKKLIEEKYLVGYDVYGPTIADLKKLKVAAGEFTEDSLSETFDKVDIVGNVVRTWKRLTPGRKTIIFGVNVAHIKNLVEQFKAAGVSATQINAYQTDDERKEALENYLNGMTTVLCSVDAAVAGFDAPDTEVCGLAVATKSMTKLTQTVGRALRIFPGKEKAFVLDFGGNFERLGFPDDFDFFGLDDGKKPKAGKTMKRERLPKVCPSCDFVKPIGVRTCPACGFTPDFKQDVEVAEADLQKLQRKTKKEYTIEQKRSFLAQLNQYCEDHGMKKHWKGFYGAAIYAYADKFGCKPSGKINWSVREPVTEEVKNYMIYRQIKYAKGKKNLFDKVT